MPRPNDRKLVNGREMVWRNGRWVRTTGAPSKAAKKAPARRAATAGRSSKAKTPKKVAQSDVYGRPSRKTRALTGREAYPGAKGDRMKLRAKEKAAAERKRIDASKSSTPSSPNRKRGRDAPMKNPATRNKRPGDQHPGAYGDEKRAKTSGTYKVHKRDRPAKPRSGGGSTPKKPGDQHPPGGGKAPGGGKKYDRSMLMKQGERRVKKTRLGQARLGAQAR